MPLLRIATRKSPLALWQAEFVADSLRTHHPDLEVELLGFTTRGDKILDTPLAKVGGKGLFVKELEQALLDGRADIAVHSMKDVPMVLPEGLALPVICEREDPRDALVAEGIASLGELPPGARVGTSSLRRQSQLRARYPGLEFVDLRGNVNTRLTRLAEGRYEAIVLAGAGLRRLGLEQHIAGYFSTEEVLPAGGQGAVGIECRQHDDLTQALLAPLHHGMTAACVHAERALNRRLNGGCQVPIAAFAEVDGAGNLDLRGLVASLDGISILRDQRHGSVADAEALGTAAAEQLLTQGADRILAAIGN